MTRYLTIAFAILSLVPLALVVLADSQSQAPWHTTTITLEQEAVGNRYGARP